MLSTILIFIVTGLVMSAPLLILGMGGVVTERSGTLNLGLEGMMLVGAFFLYFGAFTTGSAILGLIIGMIATMGVKVRRIRMISLLYTGLIAGLAGAALSIGDVRTFTLNMTVGKGFIAFACIVFGRYTPIGIAIGCLVFGMSEALRNFIQIFKWDAFIPGGYMTAILIPYIITLLLLVFSKQGAVPKAWAEPYESADE